MPKLSHSLFITYQITIIIACTVFSANAAATSATTAVARANLPQGDVIDFGPAPDVHNKPLSENVHVALETAFGNLGDSGWDQASTKALKIIEQSEDPRLAWIVTDAMRFVADRDISRKLTDAANTLLGTNSRGVDAWHELTERLIDWDTTI